MFHFKPACLSENIENINCPHYYPLVKEILIYSHCKGQTLISARVYNSNEYVFHDYQIYFISNSVWHQIYISLELQPYLSYWI